MAESGAAQHVASPWSLRVLPLLKTPFDARLLVRSCMQMEPHAHSWRGCGWTHTLRTMAHAARVWFFMTLSVLLALIVLLHAGVGSREGK